MKSVAVIEGFAGGPMLTSHFRKALVEARFKIIKDRRKADIIIAHSAGMYSIPSSARATILLLIGPTYWPGESLIKRVVRSNLSAKHYHVKKYGWGYYIRKKTLELYYVFRRNLYMWYGIFNNNKLTRLEVIVNAPGRKTIIVLNKDDPFNNSAIKRDLHGRNVRFVEMPGMHDDFFLNPRPYIDLIKQDI